MPSLEKTFLYVVAAVQAGHILCCGLPLVMSALSLLAGLGVAATLPPVLSSVHETLHVYEFWIIAGSGALLALGWGADIVARRRDCHATGCTHGPCGERKKGAHWILMAATAIFALNAAVTFFFHQ